MIKNFITLIFLSLFFINFASPTFASEHSTISARNAFIPKGTVLKVELTKGVSSKDAKIGNKVLLRLLENLIINDVLILESGSDVKCEIIKRQKAGLFGRGGKLEISVISVKAVNGLEIPLQYSVKNYGRRESVATMVLLPTVATIIGGIFVTGSNVFYKPGLRFEIEISEDIDLKVPIEKLKENMISREISNVTISRQ